MTNLMTLRFGTVAFAAIGCLACSPSRAPSSAVDIAAETAAVSAVLDSYHHNASVPDEDAYFALFAPDAVFLGTDAGERWPLAEFRTYAHARFERGDGWTYRLRTGTRHVTISPGGDVAWFDELLDNENYGLTRGSGVLRSIDGQWKIAQYHLTIPVPNELARDVVAMIRALPAN
jgi:ketosteroid isomerase-like protein